MTSWSFERLDRALRRGQIVRVYLRGVNAWGMPYRQVVDVPYLESDRIARTFRVQCGEQTVTVRPDQVVPPRRPVSVLKRAEFAGLV